MAEKKDVTLKTNQFGAKIDVDLIRNQELTDDQARTVVMQYLAEAIDGLASAVGELARATRE